MSSAAFNPTRYLDAQIAAFQTKLTQAPRGGRTFIEFGGKPIDDQHAARVLPGYDPDLKIELLRHLADDFAVIVVVAARDLLKPRIRGDSQLFYDRETVKLVDQLRQRGVPVDTGVVTLVEHSADAAACERLESFIDMSERRIGIRFVKHPRIPGYPRLRKSEWMRAWDAADPISVPSRKNVLVLSPGGGSGKFGLCVAELCRDYRSGINSFYAKFETFPVFGLPPEHPVNVAFVAATADLGNIVRVEHGGALTTYDKDQENFRLLLRVHRAHCPDLAANPITTYAQPSDMGVNRILDGFVDEYAICAAALDEIARRGMRYRAEIARGVEVSGTLQHFIAHARKDVGNA